MTGQSSSRPAQEVTDAVAARLLLSQGDRRFLEPFLGRELSTAEAARLLGESVEDTAYRVRRLAANGLLSVVRRQPRSGRPVTIYTAPTEFRAPLSVFPSADVTRLFDSMDAGGRSAFLAAVSAAATRSGVHEWVVRVHRAEDGQVLVDMVSAETEADPALLGRTVPAVVFNWVPVAMDDAAAKELQRRMAALVADLPVSTSAPTHLVGLFLTPLT